MAMTLEDFKAARRVLDGVISPTHLVHSPPFPPPQATKCT